jgi:integrase
VLARVFARLLHPHNSKPETSPCSPSPPTRTLTDWWPTWLVSRIDVDERTRTNYGFHWKRIEPTFGRLAPEAIDHGAVQAWINEQAEDLTPPVVRDYAGTLRQLLDFVGVEPNPARHPSLRLPRAEREIPTPPSDAHVLSMLEHMPRERRLLFAFLEQTGVRIGEPVQWTWGDADIDSSRILSRPEIVKGRRGRTKAALGAGARLADGDPARSGPARRPQPRSRSSPGFMACKPRARRRIRR